MAGLTLEDMRAMSWKTFEAVLELDEWSRASDEERVNAEDAFWGF